MSDLAATNCGGCNGCGDCGSNNCIWLIILLLLFDNNGCGCNNSCGGCGGCGNNNSAFFSYVEAAVTAAMH
jgi:hypothetical protein